MSEWIKCNEELPEESMRKLLICRIDKNRKEGFDYHLAWFNTDRWILACNSPYHHSIPFESVIAWQEIEQPTKTKGR